MINLQALRDAVCGVDEYAHVFDWKPISAVSENDVEAALKQAAPAYPNVFVAQSMGVLRGRYRVEGRVNYALIGESVPRADGGFGVSRERVRQIEAKALRRLRHPTRRWVWVKE